MQTNTTHMLASYVPHLIRQRLTQRSFAEEPQVVTEDAVLLLGDIKGSTGIVERVGREGALALETLTANLDTLFADFINEIYAEQGDVLYIAGDAFLCYWPVTDDQDARAAVARAARSGLLIQRKLGGREDGFGDELIFRIGLGAGQLHRAFVGGESGRWELILSGDAFEQVSAAEKNATPGRVLASPSAWSLLAGAFAGEQTDHGVELEPRDDLGEPHDLQDTQVVPELTDQLLLPFIPPSVSQRQISATHAWLSEFRHVTVLMADLPNLVVGSDEGISTLHRSIRHFQSIAEKFESSIKVDVDDKGIMLLTVFGLSPMAHEDDAARAINASWELQARLRELGVSCGIGIASGRALCAPLGNNLRREYMVRGDVINRAARLMHATDSTISCDEATYRATREDIDFEALPTHLLKGISKAVEVRRPIGTRHAMKREHQQLIGRSSELKQLETHLAQVISNQRTGTVIVEGEAGLGKTSLVDEFARRASNQGARVLRAQADSIERASSLHAWRNIFAGLFGLTEGIDGVTRRERVFERMSRYPELEPLTPLLSTVVGIEIEDNDTTKLLEGDVRAATSHNLLARILRDFMASAPSVLVVEDAHWFDSGSWELLVEVANGTGSSCIVVATRPTGEPFPDWKALNFAQTISLSGFDQGEIRQLIARRIGVQQVPAKLMEMVLERSSGNPFFSEQIVRAMIDDGVLSADQGICRINDIDTFTIPANIEGIILSRLDRLPENELLLIKTASIVGSTFGVDAVAHSMATQVEDTSTEEELDSLARAGFVDRIGPGQYQFRHIITRDVTYGTLAVAQRTAGHAAVARWLEASDNANPAIYALLAHHHRQAGDLDRALAFVEKAGEYALRNGSFREAQVLYEQARDTAQALGLSQESRRAALWWKGIGTAHYFLGEMELSREYIEAAVGILDRSLPHGRLATIGRLAQAILAQFRSQGRKSQTMCDPDDKPVYDVVVDCYKMLGQLYFLEGEAAEQLAYLSLRGLNVGEFAGSSTALACILINTSYIASVAGLDRPARWYAERARAMTESGRERAAATYVWHIDALRHAQHGDWREALTCNNKAHELMAELHDHTLATEAAAVRSTLTLCTGDLLAAADVTHQAGDIATENGNNQYYCWALLDQSEIALAKGDIDEAERCLQRALEIDTDEADLSSTLDKQHAIAMLSMRQERFDEALQAASEVCRLIAASPPTSYYFLDFYASAVEVHVNLLARKPDAALASRTRTELKRLGRLSRTFTNVRSRYWLLKGMADQASGRNGKSAFEKARDIALELSATYDEARALAAIAQLEPQDSASRRRAEEIFAELGQQQCLADMQLSAAAA